LKRAPLGKGHKKRLKKRKKKKLQTERRGIYQRTASLSCLISFKENGIPESA